MNLNAKLRHALLMAERSRDPIVITAAIKVVMDKAPGATLLDVDMTFRDAGAPTHLIAGRKPGEIVLVNSLPQLLAQLSVSRMTPEQNRAALGAR
jgi:hypothetical protein